MESDEILHVLSAIIVLGLVVSLGNNFSKFSLPNVLFGLLFIAIIFIVNIASKKMIAYYVQAGVETKIWKFQRFGFAEREYFKTPIPIGIILPILVALASLGGVNWLAATQSEIRARKARVAKRHDFYSYSEMTEFHIGLIPAVGILACLVLAFIAYLINVPELGKLAVLFAVFNMLPLGNLDGTKIFFGSVIMWFVLAAISLIALGYVIFLP